MSDGPQFWTLNYDGRGRVHVHGSYVDGEDYGRANMPFDPWLRSRCGLLRRSQEAAFLGSFDDERLCVLCVRATPEDERNELFEHDVDQAECRIT